MNFLDQFKELFSHYNLPKEKIEKYAFDFLTIASFNIFAAAETKLSEEVKSQVQNFLENKNFDQALTALSSAFPPAEWDVFVSETVTPLIDEYMNEVVKS